MFFQTPRLNNFYFFSLYLIQYVCHYFAPTPFQRWYNKTTSKHIVIPRYGSTPYNLKSYVSQTIDHLVGPFRLTKYLFDKRFMRQASHRDFRERIILLFVIARPVYYGSICEGNRMGEFIPQFLIGQYDSFQQDNIIVFNRTI